MAAADRQPMLFREEAQLLREAARAAADSVELAAIVERFAELTLDATEAWRATVFLIEDNRLVLWANQSREDDPATRQRHWERGLALGGIDLDEVPERRMIFEVGEPVAISDAAASDLVPDSWVETFGLGALVVAPLAAGGEPLGLLVADWPDATTIAERTTGVVGAIASSLALAVRTAMLTRREIERSDALQSLLEATTVLRSSAGLEEMADRLTRPLARALGANGVAICIFEGTTPRWRTLAAWNSAIDQRGSLLDLARPLHHFVADAWRERREPIVLSADQMAELTPRRREGPVAILPLSGADASLLGFVLVTLGADQPPARSLELAKALTAHLSAAIERAHLQESLALETERLRGLCALWGFEADALEAYSAAIEEAIGPALGFRLVRVSIADDHLRSLAYFSAPDELDQQLMERWRGTDPTRREALRERGPGELATPLTVRGRIVGVVRARSREGGLSQREAEMLDVLAAAFGRAIEQEWERRETSQTELDLALAQERERVAARLHDTVGRLLYALNLKAGTLRLAAGDMALADEARQLEGLARSGLASLRKAVATLASMRVDDRGLVASLERLASEFQEANDAAVALAIDGGEKTLPGPIEDALFRVAQEALANVERHARAGSVTIALDLRDQEVVLRVRDDGLGLGNSVSPAGTGLGLDLARKALAPVGGTLDLRDGAPGVEVVARIPSRTSTLENTR